MSLADRLREKLEAALAPARLAIFDDSHRHRGHAGARPGGETHFRIEVTAAAFAGKSRLERQRLVYSILADELGSPIHALQLKTMTPNEENQEGNN